MIHIHKYIWYMYDIYHILFISRYALNFEMPQRLYVSYFRLCLSTYACVKKAHVFTYSCIHVCTHTTQIKRLWRIIWHIWLPIKYNDIRHIIYMIHISNMSPTHPYHHTRTGHMMHVHTFDWYLIHTHACVIHNMNMHLATCLCMMIVIRHVYACIMIHMHYIHAISFTCDIIERIERAYIKTRPEACWDTTSHMLSSPPSHPAAVTSDSITYVYTQSVYTYIFEFTCIYCIYISIHIFIYMHTHYIILSMNTFA